MVSCAFFGSYSERRAHNIFMMEQREKIRKRVSARYTQLSQSRFAPYRRASKSENKNNRVEAPKVGGPKNTVSAPAAPPAVPQDTDDDGYIDLTSGDDSGNEPSVRADQPGMDAAAPSSQQMYCCRQPLDPLVPATIAMLWSEVEAMYDRGHIDAPLCKAHDCPYCTGPLMAQRHDLMKRLVMLEKMMYLGYKNKT